jgi:hypothetical protein
VSAEVVLDVSDPVGADAGRLYASIEQVGCGDPAIRLALHGHDGQSMTLAQAWRQSLILQDLVRRALGGVR